MRYACYKTKTDALQDAAVIAKSLPGVVSVAKAPIMERHWIPTLVVTDGVDLSTLDLRMLRRVHLISPTGETITPPEPPREKRGKDFERLVLRLLSRKRGATVEELSEATTWLKHSIRSYVSVHARQNGWALTSEKHPARGRVYHVGETSH